MKTHALLPWIKTGMLPSIIVLAFIIRFALAPMQGLDFDIGTNQGWARSAVELGLARSYSEQVGGNMLPNYPPFSLMMFGATGYVYRLFVSPTYDTSLLAHRMIIKFPAMLADVLLCLAFAVLIGRWRGRRAGMLAALLFALHPAAIYESAIWGQTDSIFTLFIVLSLLAILWRAPGIAGALITLAALTKAQTIAVLPLFAALYLLRPRTILSGAIGGLSVAILVLLPFALGGALTNVWKVYTGSVGYYPILSSSAYNFWWSLFADGAWSKNDGELLFGLLSYRMAGFLIVGAIMATVLWMYRKKLCTPQPFARELTVLFLIASTFSLAFFLFMTEMHERYLFPFIALGLPIAFLSRRAAFLYGSISLLFFFNLLGYLPLTPVERALHATFPSLDVFFASAQVFLFILWMRMVVDYSRDTTLATVPAAVEKPGRKRSRWFFLRGLLQRK